MNNKTDIERDITILEGLADFGLCYIITEEYQAAIKNVLADRERLEKENEEMQVEIAEQVYFGSMPLDQMREFEAKANKYDSLIENIKKKKSELENQCGGNIFHVQQTLNAEIRLLEELEGE